MSRSRKASQERNSAAIVWKSKWECMMRWGREKHLSVEIPFDPNITPTDMAAAYVGDMLQTVHSKD